ncbi:succinate dehydrogenase, hydrophobic membrane anchor protein [Candidatus Methylomicrobium oryzae]|uniref:succinate dehydrogenase, hydrophobic membrane anchor protein n=1 Tax=Candidatus Methylomicrobium oryzae TaxID=2802053 RepID=UPI001922EAC3|nr:succinate dehydrogenase, hydrophobic membrane anchor protein [Methylomicrobium sp. RS1]MBL1264201.1 succinate dehydrogenase, hydrophobic membrane anchor protein [Methylomicrobium sp. RS1]
MKYRTPLAKARGLGAARSGTTRWWMERVTAAALIPLSYWLVKLVDLSATTPYAETRDWLAAPVNTVGVIAFVAAAFYHAALGLRVVIEDYVDREGSKIVLIWLVNLGAALLSLIALLAVFRTLQTG